MADGRYDPGVTEPGWPALRLDGLEAVVFDTDGVLTDTASVHAAAWKRLFDEDLQLRATPVAGDPRWRCDGLADPGATRPTAASTQLILASAAAGLG